MCCVLKPAYCFDLELHSLCSSTKKLSKRYVVHRDITYFYFVSDFSTKLEFYV